MQKKRWGRGGKVGEEEGGKRGHEGRQRADESDPTGKATYSCRVEEDCCRHPARIQWVCTVEHKQAWGQHVCRHPGYSASGRALAVACTFVGAHCWGARGHSPLQWILLTRQTLCSLDGGSFFLRAHDLRTQQARNKKPVTPVVRQALRKEVSVLEATTGEHPRPYPSRHDHQLYSRPRRGSQRQALALSTRWVLWQYVSLYAGHTGSGSSTPSIT